jgi:hypothetical protein
MSRGASSDPIDASVDRWFHWRRLFICLYILYCLILLFTNTVYRLCSIQKSVFDSCSDNYIAIDSFLNQSCSPLARQLTTERFLSLITLCWCCCLFSGIRKRCEMDNRKMKKQVRVCTNTTTVNSGGWLSTILNNSTATRLRSITSDFVVSVGTYRLACDNNLRLGANRLIRRLRLIRSRAAAFVCRNDASRH